MHNDDELTTAQVAALLGSSRKAVRGAVERGELEPSRKLPGQTGAYLFRTADVDELLRVRREKATA